LYRGPSFETIAGFASNGAIVHYRATPETCKRIEGNSLLLLDSGGQYLDGTTDVTRTICIGEPSEDQKRHYTLVLKGHINLAMARFPQGTTGTQLDAIARFPLWQEGLDYDHGTGHGVGSYSSVHEGPHGISKTPNSVPLQPGMILSNEPGYYKENHYGIRIENLVMVKSLQEPFERHLLEFETLTLVPLDRKLIDEDMLTPTEWSWLNDYHRRVRESLLPHLDPDTAAWLVDATEEI
jgi:Xaa-Pro aminopeptidase